MISVSNEIIYKRIPERREITKRAYNVMSIQVYDQIWKETENRVRVQITDQIWGQIITQLDLSL
jgi:hypothetical protein